MMEDRTPNSYDRYSAHTSIRSIAPGIVAGATRDASRRRVGAILGLLTGVVATLASPVATDVHARPISATSGDAGTRGAAPRITITANRDTIFSTLENLRLKVKREQPGNRLTVTVKLEQERQWLVATSHDVTIGAGDTIADLTIARSDFKSRVRRSGTLTATVDEVSGYETADAKATVFVISQEAPVVTFSLSQDSYTFAEDVGRARAQFVARMASGMPRAVTVSTLIATGGKATSGPELTAVAGEDFEATSGGLQMVEEKYELENGVWVGRTDVVLPLFDDDVREGTETFELQLAPVPELSHTDAAQLLNPDGSACGDRCRHLIHITDEEDIPAMEFSVRPNEIMEEDETSATATLAITDHKSFAGDQVLTLALGGSATKGSDYVVSPDDADLGTTGYQVVLPAASNSVQVTLKAMSDDVDDPDEKIEVSPKLDGRTIDDMQAVKIMQQQQEMPKITLAANRDTVIAGLEAPRITLTREAPLHDALTVTVQLTQEQSWLSVTSYNLTFRAGAAEADLLLTTNRFSTSVVESGDLTAAVDSVDGYDTDEATATVFVVSQAGPAVTVSLTQSSYLFEEDADSTDLIVTARMAVGAPRGASFFVSVSSEGRSESRPELTAVSLVDYSPFSEMLLLREEDYALENGRWETRRKFPVTLLDDDVREGRENFQAVLEYSPGLVSEEIRLLNPDGTACSQVDECRYPVFIDDDEDIPTLDLSVSADEINEEDEASSTATVSITNGKTFAADQTVTFAFAGTATEGTDYTVAPADGDDGASDHQIIMLADSTSVAVTLTAIDDAFEEGNETIEVSAAHEGDAIGSAQTIRILNQEVLPKITLTASRDTIIAGLEILTLTLTREEPFDDALTVTVQLAQEQSWLPTTSYQLNFPVHSSATGLVLTRGQFSSAVTESGTLTATIDSVSGYDMEDATATVHVVSQAGPAIKVSFAEESYRFTEDEESPAVTFVARAAAGMPRGATSTFSVSARSGSAASPGDYEAVSETITVQEEDFTLEDGTWQARPSLSLTLVDDDVREGDESFDLLLEMVPGHPPEVQLSDLQGAACRGGCRIPVEITDDEDIPDLELSVSDDEIMEEGETSSIATVSITNGKTFADDQMLTFELGGDAIPVHDYGVTPADADEGVGHQVLLPAGSTSVEATFTAANDELEEPTEKILLSVTHDGNEIGSGTIRLIDRFPGPRVEIAFDGVQPPRDKNDDGIATGPFTTRITFSERVDGFTKEDIDWQTHYLTTVDTTVIGVLLWDYEEVRPGLEYTARMMPTQNGRLHIFVPRHSAKSVGTGDGNQSGHGSLQIELPPNRLMVEPRALTVDEGDDEGAVFVVVPTSAPTGKVTVTVSGMDGTDVEVDWSTWTFGLPYWSGGWGVRVTAGHDANTRDEAVTLRVAASGGGYGGRSANVVVTVRDDDGGSGGDIDDGDVDDEAAALIVLEGMTPETAAAALFGEHDLSAAQLAALDRLGNRNGHYDLGDLLSWTEHCRRAAGSGSRGRDGRRHGRTVQRMRRRDRGLLRRRPGRPRRRRAPWFAPLLVAAATWSCTDDVVQPPVAPDPGLLTIELTAPPTTRDIGGLLVVEGPGIDSIRAPGFELFQSEAPGPRQIVVAGTLTTGPIAEFHVPDRALHTLYRARLLEVTGEDYSLRDLSGYEVVIRR